MNWFIIVLKKYATFSGRAQRAEFWYFILFYLFISWGLSIIDGILGLSFSKTGVGFLGSLLNLGLLIPCIAVAVRRLHDTGRSGWWLLILLIPLIGTIVYFVFLIQNVLILLIPLIGTIVYFVFLIQDGTAGDNSYGPNPKNIAT